MLSVSEQCSTETATHVDDLMVPVYHTYTQLGSLQGGSRRVKPVFDNILYFASILIDSKSP